MDDRVYSTLSLIRSAKLPHPSSALLSSFVTEALDPYRAASYVSERLSADEDQSIVSDWTFIIDCSMYASPVRTIHANDLINVE